MVRALDKADAMLTLSSALQYQEPFTILFLEYQTTASAHKSTNDLLNDTQS